ncbi:O-methyltransferase, variant [Blastomyces dermatitidis ER-3]|uniref:O-methyltransferase n=2 Tax=Ajellomyces dermatitidis TaxID=5039 RepID=F2TFM0_AJEDA|nr:O-methyltransferase [Blastomyces dermatitidis ER-3]XP_045280842.1 O-methyltransferase, variant [Blastomyces dermatitidis ER-3]EGE82033.1 O-methyltransferase [Blastomyces dermatitidis ATCC 18188]EEQ89216.1 O-methyltransferase [Blastomyces dermatitidis ER-3]KMW67666.1 O-methyltransferase, variant [Blastomyces dermatitidis ATCC 18188]OAT01115.1 O-methyltransferase, variant [Blastomyces dermatitidis ER-3]
MPPSPVVASQKVLDLLQKLHAASLAQEHALSTVFWFMTRKLRALFTKQSWSSLDDTFVKDKFIALEADKSEFLYLLARASGATTIVEAGTSFGVSTIYLALAAGQNAAALSPSPPTPGQGAKVIATEKEPEKAQRARDHWKEAGPEVEPWITLLEGDLNDTLPAELKNVEKVDLLLLDIWTPLALPALKIVQPKLRHGALIIADNTASFRSAYEDFFAYVHDPKNGFRTMTTPFKGGLEVIVYLPTS